MRRAYTVVVRYVCAAQGTLSLEVLCVDAGSQYMWTVALDGPELIAQEAQNVLVDDNWCPESKEAIVLRDHPFLRCVTIRA